jgi:hypothetical protein
MRSTKKSYASHRLFRGVASEALAVPMSVCSFRTGSSLFNLYTDCAITWQGAAAGAVAAQECLQMDRHALLFIFTNVAQADESNFNRWYDREHLVDRIEVPGFTSSRRYQSVGTAHWKYLAIYEAEGLQVFDSPVYRERLAAQSPWSKQVLPLFVDPQRTIAKEVSRQGTGFGTYMSIHALRPWQDADVSVADRFSRLAAEAIEADDRLIRIRLLAGDPELSRPVAEYRPGRPSPISGEDWFVFAEASEQESLDTLSGPLASLPVLSAPVELGAYKLRIGVDRGDAAAPA